MVELQDSIDFSALKKKDIAYAQILLWHIDRISKAMSFDNRPGDAQLNYDPTQVYSMQVLHLLNCLKPYHDAEFKKAYNSMETIEDETTFMYYGRVFSMCIELLDRLGLLLPQETEEDIDG